MQSPRWKIIEAYRKNFQAPIKPHFKYIQDKLFRKKTSDAEGSHSQNRYKYFTPYRHLQIADVFQRFFPEMVEGNLRILDIGCGFGEYLATARAFNNQVTGINGGGGWYIDDFLYVNKLLDLDVKVCNVFEGLPFPDKSFDYVFSVDFMTLGSISHKVNYILEESYRVAAKNVLCLCHSNTMLRYDDSRFSPRIYMWHRIVRDYHA